MSRSLRPQTWALSEGGGVRAVQILATLFPTPSCRHTRFLFGKKWQVSGLRIFRGKDFLFPGKKVLSLPVVGTY